MFVDTDQVFRQFNYTIPAPPEHEAVMVYPIELMTTCSLRCGLCPQVNRTYRRKKQVMSLDLFTKILDKIKRDSPSARIFPYGYCEPFLHPQLPELLRELQKREMGYTIASNLNRLVRLEEVLLAGPASVEVSVSGFCQDTYGKAHIGGNIEIVKRNMRTLRETMDRLHSRNDVNVIYHMYRDNLGEDYERMKEFAAGLGFNFCPAWARIIGMEDILKYMRTEHLSRYVGAKEEWLDETPLPQEFYDNIARCVYLPQDFTSGAWKDVEVEAGTCPYGKLGLYIHSDGQVRMCGFSYDDRYLTGSFLDTPIEQILALRQESLLCKECYANNLAFYEGYVGLDEIHRNTAERLDARYAHRRLGRA
jgi:MoaA/NifB/PqqE/SkfB family radical SAM enzyme